MQRTSSYRNSAIADVEAARVYRCDQSEGYPGSVQSRRSDYKSSLNLVDIVTSHLDIRALVKIHRRTASIS